MAAPDHPKRETRNKNYHVIARTTPQECAEICDNHESCVAFEYGTEQDSKKEKGTIFKKGDCFLQSSRDNVDPACGDRWNLDVYVKNITTASPTTAAPTTAAPTTAAGPLPARNTEKGKMLVQTPGLPVRWNFKMTITLLGVGDRSKLRNIIHVNKTTSKKFDDPKWNHMYPKISFMPNSDFDLQIATGDCAGGSAAHVYQNNWKVGETYKIFARSSFVQKNGQNADIVQVQLWINDVLVGTYQQHKFCQNTWEYTRIYMSNQWDESANVHISMAPNAISYTANGDQPNNYPWNNLKNVRMWKKNYRLRFTCKILGRGTANWQELIHVGRKGERMPAVYWKQWTRYTLYTSHVKNSTHWRNNPVTMAAFKTGYTFQYEWFCNWNNKGFVKIKAPGGVWVTKSTGTCDFGYTNGRSLDVWMTSPWIIPADVHMSGVTYDTW